MARNRRCRVDLLPPVVRQELDRRILAGTYGADHRLASWLVGLGHKVSINTVNRYVKRLRARSGNPIHQKPPLEDLFRWRDRVVMLETQAALLKADLDREISRRCRLQSQDRENGA